MIHSPRTHNNQSTLSLFESWRRIGNQPVDVAQCKGNPVSPFLVASQVHHVQTSECLDESISSETFSTSNFDEDEVFNKHKTFEPQSSRQFEKEIQNVQIRISLVDRGTARKSQNGDGFENPRKIYEP